MTIESIHNVISGNVSSSYSDSFLSLMIDRFGIQVDKDWTERQCKMYLYKLFYEGTVYDNLIPWHREYSGTGESANYIPIVKRRPCIIYNMPKIIVNDSVSMLFGSDHYPVARCNDAPTEEELLLKIQRKSNLPAKMLSAARTGSLGSACIVVKVLNRNFYFDVLSTINLWPVFDKYNPRKLVNLREKVKVRGETLVEQGYEIEEKNLRDFFWVQREWTEEEEIYYLPYLCKENDPIILKDEERSAVHDLGFVPAVWIKNTVSCHSIDGECTFRPALDISVEVDYQLSQLARLLRYNSDPTMVIKNPDNLKDQQLIKGSGALMLGKDGDAYMLEMSSASTNAVIDYSKFLRELALESVRGNRSNPDKMHTVNSGKALQMLNAQLISLVDEMRICYGDEGLLEVLKMVLMICKSGVYDLEDLDGIDPYSLNIDEAIDSMILHWPSWYPDTSMDDLQEAQTLATLTQNGVISNKTALSHVADKYSITDEDDELGEIEKQNVKNDEKSLTINKNDSIKG